jgi:hypothetical protein
MMIFIIYNHKQNLLRMKMQSVTARAAGVVEAIRMLDKLVPCTQVFARQ